LTEVVASYHFSIVKVLANRAGGLLLAPTTTVRLLQTKTPMSCLSTSARQTAKPARLGSLTETVTQLSMICPGTRSVCLYWRMVIICISLILSRDFEKFALKKSPLVSQAPANSPFAILR